MKKLLKALGITIALTAIGVGVRARVRNNNNLRFVVFELNGRTKSEALEFMLQLLKSYGAEYVNHEVNDDEITILFNMPH